MLSRCLELAACRYDGAGIRSEVVRLLGPYVEWVPVCPEVEIGLGVPRPPIRIEAAGSEESGLRLVEPSTGRDLTDRMLGFARSFADGMGDVDGAILKSRSPSCGLGDVKVHRGGAVASEEGTGMFAAVLRARFPELPMEDEARLLDPSVRRAWLTRVFERAGLRVPESLDGSD